MTEPSPATRRRICAELARAMGWKNPADYFPAMMWREDFGFPPSVGDEPQTCDARMIPDYFTDHAANAELMAWLRGQSGEVRGAFFYPLTRLLYSSGFISEGEREEWALFTSPLPVRVLAACAALGISTGDE